MSYKLICVLGPTASGKTKYAVELAKRMDGEIISADSRQVYRGMDIGTGKDLADYCYEEDGSRKMIPYHLIDIVDAGTKYDICKYQRDFISAYNDIVSRGKFPIMCGGSGLYIEAALRGYELPDVPANPQLRRALEKESDEVLIARLASLKTLHNHTDYDNRKRLIRALEIAVFQNDEEARKSWPKASPEELPHPEHSPQVPVFGKDDVKYIGLKVSREVRNARIDARLEQRLSDGMVEEIQGLLDRGIPADNLIYYGLEYKFVTLYLMGELTYEQMKEKLAIAIHQFAKRQMTWFRGMERKGIDIEWVDPL